MHAQPSELRGEFLSRTGFCSELPSVRRMPPKAQLDAAALLAAAMRCAAPLPVGEKDAIYHAERAVLLKTIQGKQQYINYLEKSLREERSISKAKDSRIRETDSKVSECQQLVWNMLRRRGVYDLTWDVLCHSYVQDLFGLPPLVADNAGRVHPKVETNQETRNRKKRERYAENKKKKMEEALNNKVSAPDVGNVVAPPPQEEEDVAPQAATTMKRAGEEDATDMQLTIARGVVVFRLCGGLSSSSAASPSVSSHSSSPSASSNSECTEQKTTKSGQLHVLPEPPPRKKARTEPPSEL